jgi:predicted amidohydrolase
MKIGFYQFSPHFGDPEHNLKKIEATLLDADVDLVVIPELANSGYLFVEQNEVNALAEPIPGSTTEKLQAIAKKSNCHIVSGMPELADSVCYNSAVLVGPEGLVGTYRKAHLFYEEKKFFKPGNTGFPVFEINGVKIGVLVCFDHLFTEAARTLALNGAQIICYPSNLVMPTYGQLTTRVRAIENQVFTILSNRCGTEDRGTKKLTYTGCSQICAPDGTVLETANDSEEKLAIVEIDPNLALDKSITELNDLFEDRRPEMYEVG